MKFKERTQILNIFTLNEKGNLDKFVANLNISKKKSIEQQIISLLEKAHQLNLVKDFIENVCKYKYYGGCDQYALFLGIILKYLESSREISILDSAEIDLINFQNGKIEVIKESKYPDKDYIPHSFLSLKINSENVLVSPKYTHLENNNLESDIDADYHCIIKGEMKKRHKFRKSRSGIFLPYIRGNDDKFNYDLFPCHIKNKNNSIKVYKSFLRKVIEI